MKINEVMELAKWFNESDLTSFEWKEGDSNLRLEKGGVSAMPILQTNQVVETGKREFEKEKMAFPLSFEEEKSEKTEKKEDGFFIKSPVVGTFYASPSPEERAFVEVGQRVKKGEVICIVEAMKLLNEITSPVDGIVKEIFVKNEDLLEFEQKIMRIEV